MSVTDQKTSNDEQQIRDLIATWLRASMAGDLPTVLNLMAEDVVFLTAGQLPMRGREAFAAASRAAEGKVRIDYAKSEVQEIRILGNFAYCWTNLAISMTPLPNGALKRRSGYTLSILRKEPQGNWVLLRDANMLAMEN